MKSTLVYILAIFLCAWSGPLYTAGESFSFVIDMPDFELEGIEYERGTYIFSVQNPDRKCELRMYSSENYKKMGPKSEPLITQAKAACFVRDSSSDDASVELVQLKNNPREGIIFFKTADIGIKKTRIILVSVALVE